LNFSLNEEIQQTGPNDFRHGDSNGGTRRANPRTLPSEQSIFGIDFQNWLITWEPKDRAQVKDWVLGDGNRPAAALPVKGWCGRGAVDSWAKIRAYLI
jgi:hypothetical protein